MKFTRRKIIIILVIVFIVIPVIATVVYFATRPQADPEKYIEENAVLINRDQDTGELVQTDPNRAPEEAETNEIVTLGLEEIVVRGALPSQMIPIREFFGRFAEERLDGKFETVTLRPQDVVEIEKGVISTTLRLGQSETLLPVTITFKNTGETQVVIEDPTNEYGGTFDSGVTVIYAD